MKKLTVLLFISIFSSTAWAYPHFVGFGYTSCATCHYNPFGNGPLNDYGRALSATAVSAKWYITTKNLKKTLPITLASLEPSHNKPGSDQVLIIAV